MKSFKGYVNENFKELVKISCAVDPKNSAKFEGLLKKENFGYNGPMQQSRYDRLGLDEFIIVGPNTPVMKWVSKNKSMIIKLAKLPMPKITFASVDVNQYGGKILAEKVAGFKPHTGPGDTLAYHLPKQLKSMQAFLNLVQKHPKVKDVDQERLKAGGKVVYKTFYKTDQRTQAELMKELDKLEKKFNEFNGQTNESAEIKEKFLQDLLTPDEFRRELEQEIEDAGYSPKVIKKIAKKGKGYEVRVASYMGSMRDIFTNMGASKINFKKGGGVNIIMVEAIDHPAYINVILQDFAKHMKRIKPHAKKAGTKLTVQGKDVRVDGLATAIKKMFDFMTSDGKGFYE